MSQRTGRDGARPGRLPRAVPATPSPSRRRLTPGMALPLPRRTPLLPPAAILFARRLLRGVALARATGGRRSLSGPAAGVFVAPTAGRSPWRVSSGAAGSRGRGQCPSRHVRGTAAGAGSHVSAPAWSGVSSHTPCPEPPDTACGLKGTGSQSRGQGPSGSQHRWAAKSLGEGEVMRSEVALHPSLH